MNQLSGDAEIVNDFVLEASESLVSVERHLLLLEKNAEHVDSLHLIFRAFHTIKGLAGFLEYEPLSAVAHETENILESIRSGESEISSAVVDAVLLAADYLRECLGILSRCGTGDPVFPANERLLEKLRGDAALDGPADASLSFCVVAATQLSVKVEASKLEHLLDMVAELLIAQRIVRQSPSLKLVSDSVLARNLEHLATVIEEVNNTAVSMRMIPVGHMFAKMERVVRDIAKQTGKQVELTTSGDSTQLNREIVEELADPMVHMIRNSVDHGIEEASERRASGKPPCGNIHLDARHEAGGVRIEISDDGRGLNKQKIFAKARGLGLLDVEAHPSEEQLFDLIFAPGFSTSDCVSHLSGRGVGMDVVAQQIQKLRGRIRVRSVEGAGCSFIFRLPLSA